MIKRIIRKQLEKQFKKQNLDKLTPDQFQKVKEKTYDKFKTNQAYEHMKPELDRIFDKYEKIVNEK